MTPSPGTVVSGGGVVGMNVGTASLLSEKIWQSFGPDEAPTIDFCTASSPSRWHALLLAIQVKRVHPTSALQVPWQTVGE